MRIKSFIKKNAYFLVFGIFFLIVFSPNLFYIKIHGDEASYFSHALTLGLDGDLDYSNEPVDSWSKNHLMPSHPIGSGILAAPFVAIFGVIDHWWNGELFLFGGNFLLDLALGVTITLTILFVWVSLVVFDKLAHKHQRATKS